MAINIAEMMTRRREDVEFPKPLPAGVYYGTIVGKPKFSEEKVSKAGEQFVMVNFPIELNGVGPGVDIELLTAVGGLTNKQGQPKRVDHSIYLTNDNQHRVWLFLESFFGKGNVIDWNSAFESLVGRKIQLVLSHYQRDENDPDSNWHQSDGCLPLDE